SEDACQDSQGRALERNPARQHAVEHHAQAVDVSPRPDSLDVTAGLFRCHVRGRANDNPFGGEPIASRLRSRQAAVYDDGPALLAEDDVARLKITVNNAGLMDSSQPVQDL